MWIVGTNANIARSQDRAPRGGTRAVALGAILALAAAAPTGAAAQKPSTQQHPASSQTAPSQAAPPQAAPSPAPQPGAAEETAAAPAQEAGERADVAGFRSARWGMTEAQVKSAIQKDFNIAPDKVHVEENPSERTTVLSITVDDLLDGAGKARVSYILGHATKKLIQVNVVWGTAVDPQVNPERLVAAANQLRALFLGSGYEPNTVVANVPIGGNAITVFQGQDADKHMTVLRLVSSAAPPAPKQQKGAKTESPRPGAALLLSYIQDPRNPDVFRLKKGQF